MDFQLNLQNDSGFIPDINQLGMYLYVAAVVFYLVVFFFCYVWLTKGRSKHKVNVNVSKRLFKEVVYMNDSEKLAYLRKVNPYVFEEMILTALEYHGYTISRGTKYSNDGGIDGKVKIKGKWHLIQAKRYSGPIQSSHALNFDKVCQVNQTCGFFIHTGKTPFRKGRVQLKNSAIVSGTSMLSMFSKKMPPQLLNALHQFNP
ncbi:MULTISPECIES: restriction endonuclease [Vibrio]|nr:restriction endonuclease [Vibrio tasmaniensis]PMO89843.1 hypothetical protein BCT01_00760 [Vibrio tasmaniensis]PMP09985.1 hypothetical protein BCS92_02330 [Vibrio tasmaniensis]